MLSNAVIDLNASRYDAISELIGLPKHPLADVFGVVCTVPKRFMNFAHRQQCAKLSPAKYGGVTVVEGGAGKQCAVVLHHFILDRGIFVLAFDPTEPGTREAMAKSAERGSLAIVLDDGSEDASKVVIFECALPNSFGEALGRTAGQPESGMDQLAESTFAAAEQAASRLATRVKRYSSARDGFMLKVCLSSRKIAERAALAGFGALD